MTAGRTSRPQSSTGGRPTVSGDCDDRRRACRSRAVSRAAAQLLATPLAGIRVTAATLRAARAAGLELGLAGAGTVLAGQAAWVAGYAAGYAGSIRCPS